MFYDHFLIFKNVFKKQKIECDVFTFYRRVVIILILFPFSFKTYKMTVSFFISDGQGRHSNKK